jgi:two-component system, OmpR family, alkaline phosphatase synthesis response regulator PhoP
MAQDAQRRTDKTILLVEDDEDTREFLTLAITTETPYHVFSMENGFDVLQRLDEVRAIKPMLLLLDYRLPSMTALDLYEQLHAIAELGNVPALVITADPLDEGTKRMLKERSVALLEKPFDIDDLIHSIEQTISPPDLLAINSQGIAIDHPLS